MKVCFYIKNNDFGPKKAPKFGLLSSDQALNKNIRKINVWYSLAHDFTFNDMYFARVFK